MKEQIEVITYEQERLNYFTNLMNKAQKRYKRLFKKFKDAPYLSAESEMLSDAGRETQFHGDVVEMLEKGYHRQEWFSVDERLPEENGRDLVCVNVSHLAFTSLTIIAVMEYGKNHGFYLYSEDEPVTHWMPLPEAPKMKGGAE
jgi:hypothetical protein